MTNQTLTNQVSCESGVLLFTTPFASPANAKHINKLATCLSEISNYLIVVGDERVSLATSPPITFVHKRIPTLHYLSSKRPLFWSIALWLLKLFWILGYGCWLIITMRKKFDIVVCYKGSYYTPILLCARLLSKKTINYLPNNEADAAALHYYQYSIQGFLTWFLRLLQHINQKIAHICVVQSLHLVERLQLQDLPHKVRLGPLYVDTEHYKPIKSFKDRPLTVGFVGRLNPEKGIMQLIAAAASMHGSGISFKIIGDGPLKGKIQEALKYPELSHVELVGWVDSSALIEHLNSFRLLVMPTSNEGVPNVLLETMACGTPVLATAVDGIPDLVHHNVTGFMLLNREPATIAQAIYDALHHTELDAIAKRGREHIMNHYSLPAISLKWHFILGGGIKTHV
jgi:glycosyltransferase involved in cell wall biosynthesis